MHFLKGRQRLLFSFFFPPSPESSEIQGSFSCEITSFESITHYYTWKVSLVHFWTFCIFKIPCRGNLTLSCYCFRRMNRVFMATQLYFFPSVPYLGDIQEASAAGLVGTVSGHAVLGCFRGAPDHCVGNQSVELCQRNLLRSFPLYRGYPLHSCKWIGR